MNYGCQGSRRQPAQANRRLSEWQIAPAFARAEGRAGGFLPRRPASPAGMPAEYGAIPVAFHARREVRQRASRRAGEQAYHGINPRGVVRRPGDGRRARVCMRLRRVVQLQVGRKEASEKAKCHGGGEA